jgi:hypothetical protein
MVEPKYPQDQYSRKHREGLKALLARLDQKLDGIDALLTSVLEDRSAERERAAERTSDQR